MSHLRNISAYKQNENTEQLKSYVEKYAKCPGEVSINCCPAAVLLLCIIRSTFSTTLQNQSATRSSKLPQASQAVPFTPCKRQQLLSSGTLVFPETVLHSCVGTWDVWVTVGRKCSQEPCQAGPVNLRGDQLGWELLTRLTILTKVQSEHH